MRRDQRDGTYPHVEVFASGNYDRYRLLGTIAEDDVSKEGNA